MARIAVLGGRTVADLARNLLVVAVMAGVGFAAGFRSPHGTGGLMAALGLVVAFGYALSWGFASLGLRVNAERALILGGPAAHYVLISLTWSGGLLTVFALLAARTYARMGR